MSTESSNGANKPKYSWKELSEMRDRLLSDVVTAQGVDVSRLSCGIRHSPAGPRLDLKINVSAAELAARNINGVSLDALTHAVPREFEGLAVDTRVQQCE